MLIKKTIFPNDTVLLFFLFAQTTTLSIQQMPFAPYATILQHPALHLFYVPPVTPN
jgi:hypothetical protein